MAKYRSFITLLICLSISFVLTALDLTKKVYSFRILLGYILLPTKKIIEIVDRNPQQIAEKIRHILTLNERIRILEAENTRLRITQWKYQQLLEENNRLRALLELRQKLKYEVIIAEVKLVNPKANYLEIDKGKEDGIEINTPVLAAGSEMVFLVGKVIHADSNSSRVSLLTDPLSHVPAKLRLTDADGLIEGNGSIHLNLNYILLEKEVKIGDTVVTSQVSEIFPEGIPIGIVTEVMTKGIFKTARVKLFKDIYKVKEVLCILKK